MKTLESTSVIGGESRIVKFGRRTGIEFLLALSGARLEVGHDDKGNATEVLTLTPDVHKALERACGMAQDTLNRHHLLPDLRDAGAVVGGEHKAKTDEGKKKELAWARELIARLDGEEVFDLLDFMPEGGSRIPAELKVHWEQAKAYYAAAKDDEAKVAKAKAKFGEFSVEAIAKALKAIADAQPDLF